MGSEVGTLGPEMSSPTLDVAIPSVTLITASNDCPESVFIMILTWFCGSMSTNYRNKSSDMTQKFSVKLI